MIPPSLTFFLITPSLPAQAPINSIERYMIQQNVQVFYDMLGMCERIMRTPLPLTYTRWVACLSLELLIIQTAVCDLCVRFSQSVWLFFKCIACADNC